MILLDLNQVMISNLMMSFGKNNTEVNEDLIRHMVLNSIRLYRNKFTKDYGTDMVICCDDKNYWRKDIFPYYKAHRKADREKSPLDWNRIFEVLNKIRDELKQHFPYKVIQIDRAEADDIIGALCAYKGVFLTNEDTEEILIISGDKDFSQLQKYANVNQFSPITKKWIRVNNPEAFLREHIMRGDRGDGVPNFLSGDNCIVAGTRQKPLTGKKLDAWITMNPKDFCDEMMLRNYKRNEALINLDLIPEEICKKVIDNYDNYVLPERRGLLNYFVKNKLKNLIEDIGDF